MHRLVPAREAAANSTDGIRDRSRRRTTVCPAITSMTHSYSYVDAVK